MTFKDARRVRDVLLLIVLLQVPARRCLPVSGARDARPRRSWPCRSRRPGRSSYHARCQSRGRDLWLTILKVLDHHAAEDGVVFGRWLPAAMPYESQIRFVLAGPDRSHSSRLCSSARPRPRPRATLTHTGILRKQPHFSPLTPADADHCCVELYSAARMGSARHGCTSTPAHARRVKRDSLMGRFRLAEVIDPRNPGVGARPCSALRLASWIGSIGHPAPKAWRALEDLSMTSASRGPAAMFGAAFTTGLKALYCHVLFLQKERPPGPCDTPMSNASRPLP